MAAPIRQAPFLVMLFIIYLVIGIYDQTLNNDGSTSDTSSFIFNAILQPWQWQGASIFAILFGITTIGIIGSVGVAIFTKSDIATLATFATVVLIPIGAVPIITIYNFIARNAGDFLCTVGQTCGPANLLGVLIAGPLMIYWIYIVLAWWMWRETT